MFSLLSVSIWSGVGPRGGGGQYNSNLSIYLDKRSTHLPKSGLRTEVLTL